MTRPIPGGPGAAFALALLFIASPALAGTVQGTAAYRERMMLPPDAVFEAQLQDISRAGAPATVLGRARLDPAGQPPFRFEIAYDDAAVKPGSRYAVRATVTHRGQLLFTTDRIYPVLDGRNAPLELLLVSARRAPPAASPGGLGALPASFEGELPGAGGPIRWHVDLHPEGRFQLRETHLGRPAPNQFDDIGRWSREAESGRVVLRGGREAPIFLMPVEGGAALRKLDLDGKPIESAQNDRLQRQREFTPIEPRLFLTGMFVYLADAANIVLCADRRSVPVAMEADFKTLEAAYLGARTKPGERLLVSVEGLLAPRPSMEAGQPPRTTLVVERFVGVWPGQRCGPMPTAEAPRPKP
ncbi:MAG: YbaY family lipoprotein [Burkholderiales bacterium]|nr:YbaY family lipoprotein [Burkholderiales bacterium]